MKQNQNNRTIQKSLEDIVALLDDTLVVEKGGKELTEDERIDCALRIAEECLIRVNDVNKLIDDATPHSRETMKSTETIINYNNETKLTLIAIDKEKREIRVKMRWIVCCLHKLGVDELFLEELKDKVNNAYETITDFEACVLELAENGLSKERNDETD